MSLVDNERTKLTATALNGVAIAAFAIGGIGPVVSVLIGNPQVSAGAAGFCASICGAVGMTLHIAGRALLGRLRE